MCTPNIFSLIKKTWNAIFLLHNFFLGPYMPTIVAFGGPKYKNTRMQEWYKRLVRDRFVR